MEFGELKGFSGIRGVNDEEAAQRRGIGECGSGDERGVGQTFARHGASPAARVDRPRTVLGGAIVAAASAAATRSTTRVGAAATSATATRAAAVATATPARGRSIGLGASYAQPAISPSVRLGAGIAPVV